MVYRGLMKVKTIGRSTVAHTRERACDAFVSRHNPSPNIHPFERAREYKRALNAVKLERLFAKPFIAAFDGHVEGVYSIDSHPTDLQYVASASADGELRIWNISQGSLFWKNQAHHSFIRAVSFSYESSESLELVSGSDDKTIKLWSIQKADPDQFNVQEISTLHPITSISHSKLSGQGVFATAGESIDVYRYGRTDPVRSLRATGHDTLHSVRFNQADPDLLAAACSDRSLLLYDLRADTAAPIHKTLLRMRSNAVSWNPAEPYYFACANEDHNGYVFDMRNMRSACNVLSGAVGAVMDIDYAPTGLELVTAGYDRAVRIYTANHGTPRDVYVTERMQRVMSVRYTRDAGYVLSGSDEGVVRLWRARAAERPGPIRSVKEAHSLQYADALKERFSNMPEVKRIAGHRHLPGWMKREARQEKEHMESVRRKEENVARHSRRTVERKSLREEAVLNNDE